MSELYDILKASNFGGSGGGDIDTSAYATALLMAIDSHTYVLSSSLKNENGETLGTPQTIDLPLETMVVGGSYDDTTKKVVLTLKNGNTVDFSVADLIDGLQSEITSSNKLNSDLISDTNQNNKFVTSAEKTKIANALTEEVYNAGKTVPRGTAYTIDGRTYTVGVNAEIFGDYQTNKAIGIYSHSEGSGTTAKGSYSHAEGSGTSANNDNSHAEGYATVSNAINSHAEGNETYAVGNNSHSEGYKTTAVGNSSHSEGSETTAQGDYSHVEGYGTMALRRYQHVQGKYNSPDSVSKYAFIIGNGTDTNNRSNAFAVDYDGKIYVNNSNTGADVSVHNSALAKLIDSGQKNLASVNSGTFTAPTTPDGARYVSIPIIGVSGDVVLYTGSLESDDTTVTTCGLRLQFADGTTQTIQINRGNNIVTNISLSGELDEIGIYPANGYTASAGKSLSFQNLMLCSKTAWDISHNYVPYRPSYDELVARITALENA